MHRLTFPGLLAASQSKWAELTFYRAGPGARDCACQRDHPEWDARRPGPPTRCSCRSAWTAPRVARERERVDPNPLQFLISGIVSAWDPVTRLLQVSRYELWVAPEVVLAHEAVGARGTASGHEERSGRRVVTKFTVH